MNSENNFQTPFKQDQYLGFELSRGEMKKEIIISETDFKELERKATMWETYENSNKVFGKYTLITQDSF